jgi:glycosyltransferase involved in cell wall biosynthesis
MTAPRHPTARRVITVHDLAFIRFPHFYPPGFAAHLAGLLRATAQTTAAFVCDSYATRDDLVSWLGVSESRCFVAHLGVSDSFIQASALSSRPKPPFVTAGPYLLHVGALVPRKDIPTLLDSFALAAREHQDLSLILAGDSAVGWYSDFDRLQTWLLRHPELASRVRYLGRVTPAELVSLYAHAASYVTTTRWEGFGLPVLEAMASGVPVVASRISSIPEIVDDLAYYAKPGDPRSFAHAIGASLSDPADRLRRITSGQLRARRFTWDATSRQTLVAYRVAAQLHRTG